MKRTASRTAGDEAGTVGVHCVAREEEDVTEESGESMNERVKRVRARSGSNCSAEDAITHRVAAPEARRQRCELSTDGTIGVCTGGVGRCDASVTAALSPIVDLLQATCDRVHAAWRRVGVPDADCEARWANFLSGGLVPYITDYLLVSEAEERSLAADNDQLLRDIFFLSERLREPCVHAGVEGVVEVMRRWIGTTAAERAASTGEGADGGNSGADVLEPASVVSPHQREELRESLLTPAFTSFFLPVPHAGEEDAADDDAASREGTLAAGNAAQAIRGAVHEAFASVTHQQARELLSGEIARLGRLADDRLLLLRALHKQRVLLRGPVDTNARLRVAYMERLQSTGAIACASPSAAPAMPAGRAGDEVAAVASTASSPACYSALSSAKSSLGNPAPTASQGPAEQAGASSSNSAEELELLLAAAAYSDSTELRGTSLCLQPRATNADAMAASSMPAAAHSPTRSPAVEVVAPSASAAGDDAPRATLFDTDTSDVDRLGHRQDLSAARIQREASSILACIADQNTRMAQQTEEELAHVRALLAPLPSSDCAPSASLPGVVSYAQWDLDPPPALQLAAVEERVRALQRQFEREASAAAAAERHEIEEEEAGHSVQTAGDHGPTWPRVPAVVRRVVLSPSYACVLRCVQDARHRLFTDLWEQQRAAVNRTLAQLSAVRDDYRKKVHDPAYARASTAAAVTPSSALQAWLAISARESPPSEGSTAAAVPSLEDAHAVLTQRLQLAADVMGELRGELRVLERRLAVVAEVEPLVASRQVILDEQRDLKEGSRERLLSKKLNMAKQLLYEESLRRRISKELPRILAQLECALRTWDSLGSPSAPLELCVGGASVRAILQQQTAPAATPRSVQASARTRQPASLSQPSASRDLSRSGTPARAHGPPSSRAPSPLPRPLALHSTAPSSGTSQPRGRVPGHRTPSPPPCASSSAAAAAVSARRVRGPSVFCRLAQPSTSSPPLTAASREAGGGGGGGGSGLRARSRSAVNSATSVGVHKPLKRQPSVSSRPHAHGAHEHSQQS